MAGENMKRIEEMFRSLRYYKRFSRPVRAFPLLQLISHFHTMAQNKGLLQSILKTLESQNRQIHMLVGKVDNLQEQLKSLQPQSYLHPIPKPRQGKEFSRSTSVAGWLFDEIEKLNENIPEGQRKYLQFPSDIPYRRLNSDCIRELEGLLSYYIPDLCGIFTWEEACSKRQKECETVIREARILPELAVFAQAAGQWALRMLCANKMRTMIATRTSKNARKHLDETPAEESVPHEGELVPGTGDLRAQAFPEMSRDVNEPLETNHLQEVNNTQESHDDGMVLQDDVEEGSVDEQEPLDQNGIEDLCGDNQFEKPHDEELLRDFPQLAAEEIVESPLVNRESEYPYSIIQDYDNEEGSGDNQDVNNPAQIQAAAQRAAGRMIASSGENAYRHERVFRQPNNASQKQAPSPVSRNMKTRDGNNVRAHSARVSGPASRIRQLRTGNNTNKKATRQSSETGKPQRRVSDPIALKKLRATATIRGLGTQRSSVPKPNTKKNKQPEHQDQNGLVVLEASEGCGGTPRQTEAQAVSFNGVGSSKFPAAKMRQRTTNRNNRSTRQYQANTVNPPRAPDKNTEKELNVETVQPSLQNMSTAVQTTRTAAQKSSNRTPSRKTKLVVRKRVIAKPRGSSSRVTRSGTRN